MFRQVGVVALVGRNGCGKTTMLKLVAGVEAPESGRIVKAKGSKVGYLHRISQYSNKTVNEVLLEAFEVLQEMQRNM